MVKRIEISSRIKVILLFVLIGFNTLAQNFQDEFMGPTGINIGIDALTTNRASLPANATDLYPHTSLTLSINENIAPFTNFTFSLTLRVTPILPNGTADTDNTEEITLEVENNLSSGVGNITDINQYILSNSYGANVVVIGNTYHQEGLAPVTNTATPDNIILTVGFSTDRYYIMPQGPPVLGSHTLENGGTELRINWADIIEARYYELEWTWIDNYTDDILVPASAQDIVLTVRDFERNSTRIQTGDTSYRIPLIYSSGFVIYRLRAVGNFSVSEDPSLSKNKYSAWTSNPYNIEGPNLTDWGTPEIGLYEIIEGQHSDNKNWQFQASYAEDGKKKEVVSYFDGSLRNRQTVTTINTDSNAIVGEVFYDAQGRPAIEVLPVPIGNNVLRFHNGPNGEGAFNLNGSGSPYSYLDFDLDAQNLLDMESDDKKMSTSAGASNYYSPSNTLISGFKDQIPNANQYPFSQIEYTPDNTGRIRRKSGVGNTHKLGSSHEMEYYYGMPEQIELNRLFGYSAGNVSHYKKNMVLDPNGQLSISYLDPQGRTIATALAGASPINLEGLEDETRTELHKELTSDLLSKVSRTDPDTPEDNNHMGSTGAFGALRDKLSFNAVRTVTFNDTRTFTYSVTAPQFTYGCPTEDTGPPHAQAYPLTYDLNVDFLNEDGVSILVDPGTNLPTPVNRKITLGGTNTITLTPAELPNVTVKRGTFGILKSLVVDREAVELYADDYISRLQDPNDACYVSREGITPAPIIIENCEFDCVQCEEDLLGAYATEADAREAYVNEQISLYQERFNNLLPAEQLNFKNSLRAQWNEALSTCRATCKDPDAPGPDSSSVASCQTALDLLLDDMSPSGQYGNGGGNTETVLNIFDEANNKLISAKTNSSGTSYFSWKNPWHIDYDAAVTKNEGHYYSSDGTISYIIVIKTMIENEDGEPIAIYEPPIDGRAVLIPIPDINNEYWIEPQYLANSTDMINLWQDSWAYSLLSYHPEYDYLAYSNALCNIQYDGFSSDGFDSRLQSMDTYEKAFNAGFLNGTLAIYDSDPYFKNALPIPFDPSSHNLFVARQNIIREALQHNFDGSGRPLVSFAYARVICNSLGPCDLSGDVSYMLNSVAASSELTTDDKNQFWNTYKAYYLGLKQRIKSVFINAYVQKNGIYNGCIGLSDAPVALVANISTYASSITSVLESYLSGTAPTAGICSDPFSSHYLKKQKRFLPSDLHYNAGADPVDLVKNFSEQADYQNFIDSGVCPLARDLSIYLDGYFKEIALSGQNITASNNYKGLYLSPNLYKEFGGVLTEIVTINGSMGNSSEQLVLRIGSNNVLLPDSDVTITLPGYNWSNYRTGVGGFTITSVSTISGHYNETADLFEFRALAKLDVGGTYKEVVVTGTTKARLTCSVDDPIGKGQYLGGGSNFDETGACNNEAYFSKAMLSLLNHLIANNTINGSAINLSNLDVYVNSYLSEFLGSGTSITWNSSGSNLYYIEMDGVRVFSILMDSTIPSGITITNVSFDLGYDITTRTITGQGVKLTWSMGTESISGSVTGIDNTLLNFLCCDDINDYYGYVPPAKTCDTYIGLLWNIPNDGDFAQASAPTTIRYQIGQALMDYVSEIVTTANEVSSSIKTIGYNAIQSGIQKFSVNSLSLPIKLSDYYAEPNLSANGSTMIHLQNNGYPDALRRFVKDIAINASITVPMDVTFCLLTYEKDNNIAETQQAIADIYANNKSKKLFFILYDTTKKTVTTPNDGIVGNDFTPLEYVAQIIGRSPIKHTTGANVYDTDYISFNLSQFNGGSIRELLANSLLNVHRTICDNGQATQSRTVGTQQGDLLPAIPCEETSKECVAQPVAPVSCTDKYQDFLSLMASMGDLDQNYSEEYFCNNRFAYITDDYSYYINKLVLSDTNPEAVSNRTNSIHYLTISNFGATQFGYGFDDPNDGIQGMQGIIDAYEAHIYNAPGPDDIKTWIQFTNEYMYYNLTGEGSFCISLPAIIPITVTTEDYPTILPEATPCEQLHTAIYNSYSNDSYDTFLIKEREAFIKAYLKHATEEVVENFDMTYWDKEYQYTLYYYDQAGNLSQTVPPQGVKRFTEQELIAEVNGTSLNDRINLYRKNNIAEENTDLLPPHDYKTQYAYNSLNQLVWQFTPDGGEARFAYDPLGRIVASQNAQQLDRNTFSYTVYDELGRIKEAGELVPNVAMQIDRTTGKLVDTATSELIFTNGFPNNSNPFAFPRNVSDRQNEVTRTQYTNYLSVPTTVFKTIDSENLFATSRNRVTEIYYFDTVTGTTSPIGFSNAIYYNYDIHGNVRELVHHNRLLAGTSALYSGLKRVEYDYDLISGNVNKVYYQKDEPDQFIHRYTYDADNRIKTVHTSSNGYIWENDASYNYYAHGPLARTVIGDKKVQGQDYAYTIQGWLKGVNSDELDVQLDLGGDGRNSSAVARDAFGYALTYNDEDYVSIGSINAFTKSNTNGTNNIRNLYNGNIKQMVTDVMDTNEVPLGSQINHYRYDQLNRIASMQGYNSSGTRNYSSSYKYDRNGNLDSLKRATLNSSNAVVPMDDLRYRYGNTKTNPLTGEVTKNNQLNHVTDTIGDAGFNDLANQSIENYRYDAIGQLISDNAEGITLIDWRADGKVASIAKRNGAEIHFRYDGLGNRIAKTVLPENKTTVYVRDAQGNVMAVYETNETDISNITANKSILLKEHHIYGSSRLGIEQKNIEILNENSQSTNPHIANNIGDKQYELSNHLGNVLAVVSDKKIPVFHDGSTVPGINILGGYRYCFSNNANENSGSGLNGIVYGAQLTTGHDGLPNSAYEFNGTTDYIEVEDNHNLDFGNSDFSISFWANKTKLHTLWKVGALGIWNNGTSPGTNEWLVAIGNHLNQPTPPMFRIENGLELHEVNALTTMQLNTWYHIVAQREGHYLKIYVNGVEEGSLFIGNIAVNNTGNNLIIGGTSSIKTPQKLDDIRILKRALTINEISELYQNMTPCNASMPGDGVSILDGYQYCFSGNANEASGSGMNGIVYGAQLTNGHDGTANSAYEFNGTTDYIEIEHSPNLSFGNKNFSVSFWANKTALHTDWKIVALGVWNSQGTSRGTNEWLVSIGNSLDEPKPPIFRIESNRTTYETSATTIMELNTWYHIVAQRETHYLKIYVNGIEEGSLYIGDAHVNDFGGKLTIGGTTQNKTAQKLDNIRILNRELTQKEISNLYQNLIPCGERSDGLDQSISYFKADVLSYNDYYPFGMALPGRHGATDGYRYGFQGQEKDDEIKGEGNSINFTFRMYDPRVGRFFSADPLLHKYPWYSPYQFAGNKVIQFSELEGLEEFIRLTNKDWMARFFKVRPEDNLHVISKVTGVAINDIIRFNPGIQENPDHIESGQILMLRSMSGLTVGDFANDAKQSNWVKDFIVELATSNENGPSVQSQAIVVMDPIGVAVEQSLGVDIPLEVDYAIGVYQLTRGRIRSKTKVDPDLPVQDRSRRISAVDNAVDFSLDNIKLKNVDILSGKGNKGWYDGETLSLDINSIQKKAHTAKGSAFESLNKYAEDLAKKSGLKNIRIEFGPVMNSRLGNDPTWAREYGYDFSSSTDNLGNTTVTWEKKID